MAMISDVKTAFRLPKAVKEALDDVEGVKTLQRRILDAVLPLPSPKDLGRAEWNALPSRMFDDEEDDDRYTWEDWEAEMRRDHPISWFLRREAPKPFHRAWERLDDAIYWLKCHTLPSYRFHILDLRNPGGGVEWDYGWRDRSEVMLWACFKILVEFVEGEQPFDVVAYTANMTEEQIDAENLHYQLDRHREMLDLYHWWKTGRARHHAEVDDMLLKLDDIQDPRERRKARDAWREANDNLREIDQRNLARLIAIRDYLWT